MKYSLVNKEIRSNYIDELLKDRGIKDISSFLNPTAEALQTWQDLENIGVGAELLLDSIETGPFALIVDSDVDGFTSAAIIYLYIKEKWPNQQIDYYLHEGKQHGLEDMWEKFQDSNYALIIAPDSSTNDSEYAEKINTPILVLDHHLFEGGLICPSMTIVNNQMSPNYKNKNLSGAGVTWQFCRALDYALGGNFADELIDLAAVGVCGDMMDGREIENQYIWHTGFLNIKNKFLKVLFDKQAYSMENKINPTTIAFYIVPLINAMIRAGTQEEKERMFLAFVDGNRLVPCNKRGARGTEEKVAIESVRECVNARLKQNRELDAAEIKIENKIQKYDLLENKILIICLDEDDDFPSELNGLIAMRESAKYKRPTLVLREGSDGLLKGSARGVNNGPIPSLKEFLDESGYFEWTAGHSMAFNTFSVYQRGYIKI